MNASSLPNVSQWCTPERVRTQKASSALHSSNVVASISARPCAFLSTRSCTTRSMRCARNRQATDRPQCRCALMTGAGRLAVWCSETHPVHDEFLRKARLSGPAVPPVPWETESIRGKPRERSSTPSKQQLVPVATRVLDESRTRICLKQESHLDTVMLRSA